MMHQAIQSTEVNFLVSWQYQCVYLSPNQCRSYLSKFQLRLPTAITSLVPATSDDSSLSKCYKPSYYDVVCGRGKGSYNRPGNQRLRAIVSFILYYSIAKTKFDKGITLNSLVEKVRSQDKRTAHFVKGTKGLWFEIRDDQAREKVNTS
jgi:hypothetical protein